MKKSIKKKVDKSIPKHLRHLKKEKIKLLKELFRGRY
jgi:hypothetical protein|tara:strand:- start:1056 stop:1166 length:111 start_codon:yes stop_codon:yes gene_type:complete